MLDKLRARLGRRREPRSERELAEEEVLRRQGGDGGGAGFGGW